MRERDTERWRPPLHCIGLRGFASESDTRRAVRSGRGSCGERGSNLLGSGSLGEPSSSRFRGKFLTQKGREAVGDGYCIRKGSVMTHLCCTSCRLRFTAAAAAYLVACPQCGRPPQPIVGAEGVVGFSLFLPEDAPREMPEAVAVSIWVQDPDAGLS